MKKTSVSFEEKIFSKKRVTMRQIAQAANVSVQAVSIALSNRPSTIGVSQATRQRILAIAKRLDYQPNPIASGLAHRKSFMIGVLCREPFTHFIGQYITGIQTSLFERGYSVAMYVYGLTRKEEAAIIKRALERQVDGLLLTPAIDPDNQTNLPIFRQLQKEGLPIVQMFQHVLSEIPSVISDFSTVSVEPVKHLAELGHRNILLLHNDTYKIPNATIDPTLHHPDLQPRIDSYRSEMIRRNLKPTTMVARFQSGDGFDYVAGGFEAAEKILKLPKIPTAVIAYCDYAAVGLIRGLAQHGIRVPEDISVIGCDDIETSRIMTPALTTLRPRIPEITRSAVEMIFDMMDGKTVQDHLVPYQLIIRQSTVACKK